MNGAPDRSVLLAFVGIVALGGLNGTAIKAGSEELAPFWGATLRFVLAALAFIAIVALRRVPLPRGRALLGSVMYGALGFGVSFSLVYWALVEAPAGLAQVVLALVPLFTLLLAGAVGLERLRLHNAGGAVIALAGVAVVFSERITGAAVSPAALLAILGAALAIAGANVTVKRFPRSHPLSNNAVAMAAGALVPLALSVAVGERWAAPAELPTLVGLAYLVLVGTVVVFTFYLIVIERWTASATSYSLLLMPLVAVAAASVLLNEPITAPLVGGGVLVLAGVYVGAFAPSLSVPLPGLLRPRPPLQPATAPAAADAPAAPPELATPSCP